MRSSSGFFSLLIAQLIFYFNEVQRASTYRSCGKKYRPCLSRDKFLTDLASNYVYFFTFMYILQCLIWLLLTRNTKSLSYLRFSMLAIKYNIPYSSIKNLHLKKINDFYPYILLTPRELSFFYHVFRLQPRIIKIFKISTQNNI